MISSLIAVILGKFTKMNKSAHRCSVIITKNMIISILMHASMQPPEAELSVSSNCMLCLWLQMLWAFVQISHLNSAASFKYCSSVMIDQPLPLSLTCCHNFSWTLSTTPPNSGSYRLCPQCCNTDNRMYCLRVIFATNNRRSPSKNRLPANSLGSSRSS